MYRIILRQAFYECLSRQYVRNIPVVLRQSGSLNRIGSSVRTFSFASSSFANKLDESAENSTGENDANKNSSDEKKSKESAASNSAAFGLDDLDRLQNEFVLLQSEVDSLKEKYNATMDKYKRALADGENMRQRMQRQIEEARIFGIQSFCKDLIAVADTLELATAHVSKDQLGNDSVKSMHDGLSNTLAKMLHVFQSHQLVQVKPAEGEKFDPNFHEALFEVADANKVAGTVAQFHKIGYALQNRCIRPAAVAVYKKT